jgi:hypothetical protein
MPDTPTSRQYWVYVGPRDSKDGVSQEITLQILPLRYQKRTATIRPLLFISERSFSSIAEARKQAEALFGSLKWQKMFTDGLGGSRKNATPTGDYRAKIEIGPAYPR